MFEKYQKCDRCGNRLKATKLTEKQVQGKIQELIEQENTINGFAPHNEKYKNFELLTFLMHHCYTYYECAKCGWFKFKKVY